MTSFDRVIPLLVYEDLPGAHDFLVEAFGFAAGGVDCNEEGKPIHAEVRAGTTSIWLHRVAAEHQVGSPHEVGVASSGLVVHVDDVDQHYKQLTGFHAPPFSRLTEPARCFALASTSGVNSRAHQRSAAVTAT